jgi:hypothetical protein
MNGLLEAADVCTYRVDTAASAEYQALSGCTTAIPLETEGDTGTACAHWSETCLKGELMTGFANDGLEISRMTVGSLEDIGYEVDYNQADPFPVTLLDPSCVCSSVQAATTGGFKLSASTILSRPAAANKPGAIKIGAPTPVKIAPTPVEKDKDEPKKTGVVKLGGSPTTVTRTRVRVHGPGGRKLSKQGEQNALNYGKELLRENKRKALFMKHSDDSIYLGDKILSVLYREGDEGDDQLTIYSLDLWAGDDL